MPSAVNGVRSVSMKTNRSWVFQAVGVVAVFLGTYFLTAASFGAFSRPPVTHTSFNFERGSLLGLVAVFWVSGRFMWPFAIGAFVLERFIIKRRGFWWALALGIVPALVVASVGHSSFSWDMQFTEYLESASVHLFPTFWTMLGYALAYVLRKKQHA